ncbi:MAG: ABC transporter permease, partial [Desulfuromonadales bacterium]
MNHNQPMTKNSIDKSRRNDRIAEFLIRVGGVMVIFSVVWILVMISRVALPLFYPASAKVASTVKIPAAISADRILTLGSEENQQALFLLDDSGTFHFLKAADGSLSSSIKTPSVPVGAVRAVAAEYVGKSAYNLLWDNGAVSSVTVALATNKDADGKISLTHDVVAQDDISFAATAGIVQSFVRPIEGKGVVRIDRLSGDRLRVSHQLVEKDLLGNEKRSNTSADISEPLPGRLTALAVDSKGHYLYAGTENGMLLRWD